MSYLAKKSFLENLVYIYQKDLLIEPAKATGSMVSPLYGCMYVSSSTKFTKVTLKAGPKIVLHDRIVI